MLIRPVCTQDSETLRRIAVEILAPLYGDQTKALNEWLTGAGHKHAFVPIKDNAVAGLLSLKADPGRQYLKISTLVVLPPCQGNGCGKAMLNYAQAFARERGYGALIVTVSETKTDSLAFFRKHGFVVVDSQEGKYQAGVVERILRKELS